MIKKQQHFSLIMLTFLMLWGMLVTAQTLVRNEFPSPRGNGTSILYDFNGDGNLDAFNGGHFGDHVIHQGDGEGNFSTDPVAAFANTASDYLDGGKVEAEVFVTNGSTYMVISDGSTIRIFRHSGGFNSL